MNTPTYTIEIERIFSMPFSCMNRGRNNEIKTTTFGGYSRVRISGQALKRAAREHINENVEDAIKNTRGIRTNNVMPLLEKRWEETGQEIQLDEAQKTAVKLRISGIMSGTNKGDGELKASVTFLGLREIEEIADFLASDKEKLTTFATSESYKWSDALKTLKEEEGETIPKKLKVLPRDASETSKNLNTIPIRYEAKTLLEFFQMKDKARTKKIEEAEKEENKKEEETLKKKDIIFRLEETTEELNKEQKKSASKKVIGEIEKAIVDIIKKGVFGPDIAINGRMSANAKIKPVDSKCMFSHAISVDIADTDDDFFVVKDDVDDREEKGGSHLGDNEGVAATMYGYANLNVTETWKELSEQGFTKEQIENLILLFVEGCARALPKARQSTMFGRTLPHYIRITINNHANVFCKADAFVHPIRGGEKSVSEEAIERLQASKESEEAFGIKNMDRIEIGKGFNTWETAKTSILQNIAEAFN